MTICLIENIPSWLQMLRHPGIRDGIEWRQGEEMIGKISLARAKNDVFALKKV